MVMLLMNSNVAIRPSLCDLGIFGVEARWSIGTAGSQFAQRMEGLMLRTRHAPDVEDDAVRRGDEVDSAVGRRL